MQGVSKTLCGNESGDISLWVFLDRTLLHCFDKNIDDCSFKKKVMLRQNIHNTD